jgi:hypothetical protein
MLLFLVVASRIAHPGEWTSALATPEEHGRIRCGAAALTLASRSEQTQGTVRAGKLEKAEKAAYDATARERLSRANRMSIS